MQMSTNLLMLLKPHQIPQYRPSIVLGNKPVKGRHIIIKISIGGIRNTHCKKEKLQFVSKTTENIYVYQCPHAHQSPIHFTQNQNHNEMSIFLLQTFSNKYNDKFKVEMKYVLFLMPKIVTEQLSLVRSQ